MPKDGFINILKPTGMTSNDLVAKLRGMMRRGCGEKIKVGHTGTLDPNAAGVMIVAVGNATKFSQYVIEKRKTYIAEILFGKRTTTLDTYGEIEEEKKVRLHTEEELVEALNKFLGKTSQIPPKFSALKINGQRLYQLARNGQDIPEIRPREIEIEQIRLLSYDPQNHKIRIEVTCSAGTYIRSLAADVGEEIGEPATLSMLIRTGVDEHRIGQSHTMEELEKMMEEKNLESAILPIDDILKKYPSLILKDGVKLYTNGAKIRASRYLGKKPEAGLYRVYHTNKFLGIGRIFAEEDIYLKSETMTK